MEMRDAVIKSIRSYYNDKGFSKYQEVSGKPMKYTKDYFDSVEEEMFPKKMAEDEMEGIDNPEEEAIDGEEEVQNG